LGHFETEADDMGQKMGLFANNKSYSDTVIYCKNGSVINMHKIVLLARLKYKASEFCERFANPKGSDFCELISSDIIIPFMTYLYTDSERLIFDVAWKAEIASLAVTFNLTRLADIVNKKNFIIPSTIISDYKTHLFSKTFSDVRLKGNDSDVEYCAHKVIMAARSTYFNSLFSSGWKEAHAEVIQLDVPSGVIRAVLEFMYTGDVAVIESEVAIDLLIASCIYSLDRLKKLMEGVVGWSLDLDNVYGVTDLAVTYDCKLLQNSCFSFCITNWAKVARGNDWKELRPEVRNRIVAYKTN